jgi:hypothetical protein
LVLACGVVFPDDAGGCVSKVPLDANLVVNLGHAKVLWAVDTATGQEISLRIPGGYGVTPDNHIVAPDGRLVAGTGDRIVSGCADHVQDAVMISEEDIRPPRGPP